MLIKDKTTQKREIKSYIEKSGWKILILDNYDFHQWSLETWLMESIWSPTGKTAYVSFLIDPMSYSEKIIEPWAFEISEEKPMYGRTRGETLTIPLNKWKYEKKELDDFLSKLRDK